MAITDRKFNVYFRGVFYMIFAAWVAFMVVTTDDMRGRIRRLSQAISETDSVLCTFERHLTEIANRRHPYSEKLMELCSDNIALQERILGILRNSEQDFRKQISHLAIEISDLASTEPGSPEELYEQASRGRTLMSLDSRVKELELKMLHREFKKALLLLNVLRADMTLRESRVYFYQTLMHLVINGAFQNEYPSWKDNLAHERNRLKVDLAQLESEGAGMAAESAVNEN